MSLSVARCACVAALSAMLAACDAERADVPAATPARPACVPRDQSHDRICALAPPSRQVDEGATYKLTTVAGESFWVVLPDELARSSRVVAVPGVPIRIHAGLTTATSRQAAAQACGGLPDCEATVVDRVSVQSGVLTRWDDASGTIGDLQATTVDLGQWTLVLSQSDATHAERVAQALRWSVDDDGYPRVVSTDREVPVDADWASVGLWVPDLGARDASIEIVSGCDLSTKQPDLGGADARADLELNAPDSVDGGRWCVDRRYSVDVSSVERPQLQLLYQELKIVPHRDHG